MKLGFIGCGNMAKAMLGGILKNEICAKEDVIATAKSEASREFQKYLWNSGNSR